MAEELERAADMPIDPARVRHGAAAVGEVPPRAAAARARRSSCCERRWPRPRAPRGSASGREDVLARFCAATRLPRFMVDDAMPLDLDETERFFGERLLGQTDAVAAVLRSVALLKAGLNDPRRPLGVFLFAGPDRRRQDAPREAARGVPLRLGRPAGAAEHGGLPRRRRRAGRSSATPGRQTLEAKRGELTRLLDGKVFTVLLLDEFEKAHAQRATTASCSSSTRGSSSTPRARRCSCNNTLIVATSNVGAEVYREPPMGFSGTRREEELVTEVDRRIGRGLPPGVPQPLRQRTGADSARKGTCAHRKAELAGYFLIVWDVIRFCQQNGILVQGRGSAANSAVCYSLGNNRHRSDWDGSAV